jgi:hypothetical protein
MLCQTAVLTFNGGWRPDRTKRLNHTQMQKRHRNDDAAESRRILGQIEQETGYDRAVNRLRNHLSATDADQSDAIETWGTRIGRGIGLVATVVLFVLFVRYLVSA